jgi:magnesium transporter
MPDEPPAAIEEESTDLAGQVESLIEAAQLREAATVLAGLRPAEAAHVLERLDLDDAVRLAEVAPLEVAVAALEFVEHQTRAELISRLDRAVLRRAVESLPDDIATDILQDLEDDQAAADVLQALPFRRRQELERLLTYPEETAGGRMTGQVVTVSPRFTVGETIQFLRRSQADPNRPFYLYVTEPDRTLIGVLNLRLLITAPEDAPVTAVMVRDVITVPATMDQEEAARLLQRHNLLSLPVVDDAGRLLGTILGDDLIDVLEEEATEDIYRMVGVHEDETLYGVWSSVSHRLPWLMVNLVTALSAAWVVSRFEDTLEQVAILAAFLPVIGGQGGNAGIQTLTVVVRSLALGRISSRDTIELLWHQLRVGLLLGASVGLTVGIVAFFWRGSPWLGGIVMVGLLVNTTIGSLTGVLIPMALQRFRQDPALSGGIWLTATTDLTGFFAFLLTATLLIERLRHL